MRRFSFASLVGMAALIAAPGSAGAATQVGETFDPTHGGNCTADYTYLQTSPAQYAAPFAGVITSWSFEAGDSPPGLKLKIDRADAGNPFRFSSVGGSSLQSPLPNRLNTYLARISVEAGDVLGFYAASTGQCGRGNDASYQFFAAIGDPVSYTSYPFNGPVPEFQFDIAARLEPDADQDGFADESQDQCVGTPGPFDGCPRTFTLDKLEQKGTKPTVKVTATVPGMGILKAGSASDPALASAAAKRSLKPVTEILTSTARHQVVLTLKLTKSAKRKLAKKGKLKTQVKVVYIPPGGDLVSGACQLAPGQPCGSSSQVGKLTLKS